MNSASPTLRNLKVLVTRPEAQQRVLNQAIAQHGGQCVSFPLLAIEPIAEQASLDRLRRQVENLDHYDLLIFVSTNAARYGGELIDSYWPQFPVGIDVLAVGPTTAQAVAERLNCVVQCSETGMASEDLLELPLLKIVSNKKVALFRGEGGRELLANTLRERGAQVDYFQVYRRSTVNYPADALVNEISAGGVNVVSAFSAESLHRLLELVVDSRQRERLLGLPILVPSQRIAGIAADAGFTSVYNANGANAEATLAGLQEIATETDN